ECSEKNEKQHPRGHASWHPLRTFRRDSIRHCAHLAGGKLHSCSLSRKQRREHLVIISFKGLVSIDSLERTDQDSRADPLREQAVTIHAVSNYERFVLCCFACGHQALKPSRMGLEYTDAFIASCDNVVRNQSHCG